MRERLQADESAEGRQLTRSFSRLARNDGTVDEIAEEFRADASGQPRPCAKGEEPRDALDSALMAVLDVDLDGVVIALRGSRPAEDDRLDRL